MDCEGETASSSSAWSVPLGIALGCCGSIGINVGNNIQALGLQQQEAMDLTKKTNLFWAGSAVFLTASIINFVAFAFAPASVLAPLESMQFVTNLLFAKFVNKKAITRRMFLGSALIVGGTTLAIVLGPSGVARFSLAQLISFWDPRVSLAWIAYLCVLLLISVCAVYLHIRYSRALLRGVLLPGVSRVLPLSFSVSSASVGTLSVVQAKCLSEVLELLISGEETPLGIFGNAYFYIVFILLASTGALWLYRLNQALRLYDPLYILPLLQSQYILFAVLSGGIHFREFDCLSALSASCFGVGIAVMFYGLYLIAPTNVSSEVAPAMQSELTTEGSEPPLKLKPCTDDNLSECGASDTVAASAETLVEPLSCTLMPSEGTRVGANPNYPPHPARLGSQRQIVIGADGSRRCAGKLPAHSAGRLVHGGYIGSGAMQTSRIFRSAGQLNHPVPLGELIIAAEATAPMPPSASLSLFRTLTPSASRVATPAVSRRATPQGSGVISGSWPVSNARDSKSRASVADTDSNGESPLAAPSWRMKDGESKRRERPSFPPPTKQSRVQSNGSYMGSPLVTHAEASDTTAEQSSDAPMVCSATEEAHVRQRSRELSRELLDSCDSFSTLSAASPLAPPAGLAAPRASPMPDAPMASGLLVQALGDAEAPANADGNADLRS